jgi:protein ImuB
MMIVCLWAPGWGADLVHLVEPLVAEAPRLALGTELIWADARGLDARVMTQRVHAAAAERNANVRAALARAPVVAQVAAQHTTSDQGIVFVPDDERAYLAAMPLTVLGIDEPTRILLHSVGIETCGELAALEREAVEVRFGPMLLQHWQWSRGEDDRRLFRPPPAEPPRASIDFVDYVISDPERLIFSVNALFGGICDDLQNHGRHARRVKLTLSLANGERWERVLRPARPTASRTVWLRLARALVERITVSDAIDGIALNVEGIEGATSIQGDLFDAGFATANAVDAAVARLLESGEDVLVEPEVSAHPRAEERTTWTEPTLNGSNKNEIQDGVRGLTLQLLPQPREVLVETIRRRDHNVPIRFRDGQWKQLVTTAGPDRISGGRWEEQPYAREYFRGVTVDGLLVWIYRDARDDRWFLHGWWD